MQRRRPTEDRNKVACGRANDLVDLFAGCREIIPGLGQIADRTVGLDQLELLFGIAGTGRDHRATQRPRRGVENEAAGVR